MKGRHGVPCSWYEYCTVETVAKNGWTRVGSYRLVRRVRASAADDPAVPGYRDDGTAFEEMVSLQGMIPNRSVRMCTQRLKLLPGLELRVLLQKRRTRVAASRCQGTSREGPVLPVPLGSLGVWKLNTYTPVRQVVRLPWREVPNNSRR